MLRNCVTGLICCLSLSLHAGQQDGSAAALYQDYCSVCHGDSGDGQSRARTGLVPPPKDFTQPGLALTLGREAMVNIVLYGKPGTAMTGWHSRLDQSQAESIVDYIRTQFMRVRESASEGAALYAENCSVCHGDDGAGSVWASAGLKPPPRNFAAGGMDRATMLAVVAGGSPGTAMTPFASQLSKSQIEAVVDYIHQQIMPAESATNQPPTVPVVDHVERMIAQEPARVKGNYASGERFYLANCVTCHGVSGAGDGPRAYFIFPKPRSFVSPESRQKFNVENLFVAIRDGVRGKEMPAWGKVLDDQQIADVAEYVDKKFIRPPPSEG